MSIRIRPIAAADAEAITALFTAIDSETRYLLYAPGERTTTPDEWRTRIAALHAEGTGEIFVAEDADTPGELAGFWLVRGETLQRLKHSATLVVAVRAAYAGQGIATRLYAAVEAWARVRGLHRLQLQVQADNHRAVALYHKLGFTVEGYHRHAVRLDEQWVDDYTMAKLLA
jgi:RimJ/RimL family protein N-acetyltransferase